MYRALCYIENGFEINKQTNDERRKSVWQETAPERISSIRCTFQISLSTASNSFQSEETRQMSYIYILGHWCNTGHVR